jgi:hypothetical protein
MEYDYLGFTRNKTFQEFNEALNSSGDLFEKFQTLIGATTTRELSEILGISPQAIDSAKRGKKVPDRWLLYVMYRHKFPLVGLLGLSLGELRRAYDNGNKAFLSVPEMVFPQGEEFSAIDDAFIEKNMVGLLSVRRDVLASHGAVEDRIVAFTLRGSHMRPTVERGDRCLISIDKNHLSPGAIFLVHINRTFMLCRPHITGSHEVRVIFDNESYPPFTIGSEEMRVVGRLVAYLKVAP